MNPSRMRGAAALAAALALTASLAGGQEPERRDGPAERVGQQLDRLLRDVEGAFRNLSGEVRERFAKARQRVDDLGLEARVYGRLHWDKALHEAELAVEAREAEVIVLHGTVADARARRVAVDLAAGTVGVSRVIDRLRIADAPAVDVEVEDDGPRPVD